MQVFKQVSVDSPEVNQPTANAPVTITVYWLEVFSVSLYIPTLFLPQATPSSSNLEKVVDDSDEMEEADRRATLETERLRLLKVCMQMQVFQVVITPHSCRTPRESGKEQKLLLRLKLLRLKLLRLKLLRLKLLLKLHLF